MASIPIIQNVFAALKKFYTLKETFTATPLYNCCAYELQHAYMHIAKACTLDDRTSKHTNAEHALKHFSRAHLDFYKMLILENSSGIFKKNGRDVKFIRVVMAARDLEIKEIGTGSFINTFAAYEEILTRYSSNYISHKNSIVSQNSTTQDITATTFTIEQCTLMKEWNALEVLLSSIRGDKNITVITNFIKACARGCATNDLKRNIIIVKLYITTVATTISKAETLEEFLTNRKELPPHLTYSKLYTLLGKRGTERTEAIEQVFPQVLDYLTK